MTPDDAGTARPPQPVEVRRRAAERTLQVTWRDGHFSAYPYGYLRGWCPCALCQGHAGARRFVEAAGDVELTRISIVGNYALGLTWSDGHETGIYSYRYLRELCPCAACAGEREG